jgi:hypothetical protein
MAPPITVRDAADRSRRAFPIEKIVERHENNYVLLAKKVGSGKTDEVPDKRPAETRQKRRLAVMQLHAALRASDYHLHRDNQSREHSKRE